MSWWRCFCSSDALSASANKTRSHSKAAWPNNMRCIPSKDQQTKIGLMFGRRHAICNMNQPPGPCRKKIVKRTLRGVFEFNNVEETVRLWGRSAQRRRVQRLGILRVQGDLAKQKCRAGRRTSGGTEAKVRTLKKAQERAHRVSGYSWRGYTPNGCD